MFYLVNDYLFSLQSLYFFYFLLFLLLFYLFQSLDFHNFILLFLLHFELFPISLFFFELSLSDSCYFCVSHHLIHLFDIVQLLFVNLKSPLVYISFVLYTLFLVFARRHFFLLFLFKFQHLLFFGLRQSQFMLLFFLRHFSLNLRLLFCRLSNGILL